MLKLPILLSFNKETDQTMTSTAFVLILLSVVLHVGWNFLCKANKHPTLAFYFIANLLAAILLIPFLFVAKVTWSQLDWRFWLAVFFSDFFEAIYSIEPPFDFKAYMEERRTE